MSNTRPIWVLGHRNPDTDSICAAIAYANLKNCIQKGQPYIPMRAGAINSETRFVLKYFGAKEPELVTDVSAQVKDIDYRRTKGVDGHLSLKRAWELMGELDVVTLPITDAAGRIQGLISGGDIAYSYMDVMDNAILGRARTQYKNIIETIGGKLITGNDHAYFVKGKVVVACGNRAVMSEEIEADDLVIVGNIPERQYTALEEGASCIIVCGEDKVAKGVIAAAEERESVIIATDYDSFTVARLIHQSMAIRHFMTKDKLITFELDDHIDDVKAVMSKVRHRDFPVLDEQRHLVGMVSRRNLLDMSRKQLILVDHNEKSQAVEGIDQAEILEIIDHHRLGSLETISPIFFRNQPVGCTSTIVYQMYQEQGVAVEPQMAGLLCSAILSDTLMFRSPTCTAVDVAAARELAVIAGINVEEYAAAMFEAGSDFGDKSPMEILYQDFKEFFLEDLSFGVSQVSAISRRQLNSIKPQLLAELPKVAADRGLKQVYVMLTDILDEDTELIYVGTGAAEVVAKAFGLEEADDLAYLPGVVSRKKQLIPSLMEAMQE